MASIEIRQALKQSTKHGFVMRKEPAVSTHLLVKAQQVKKSEAVKPEAVKPEAVKPEESKAIDIGSKGSGPQQPSVRTLRVHREE